jgi:hypothetical protein
MIIPEREGFFMEKKLRTREKGENGGEKGSRREERIAARTLIKRRGCSIIN